MQPSTLKDLVERWKPDYVFFTVVDRHARDARFTAFPSDQTQFFEVP